MVVVSLVEKVVVWDKRFLKRLSYDRVAMEHVV